MSACIRHQIDGTRVAPHVAAVQVGDDSQRLLRRRLVFVLECRLQEILHRTIQPFVALFLVRPLDVRDDVAEDHDAKLLVWTAEKAEEERQELGGLHAPAVAEQDERGDQRATQVGVQQRVVFVQQLDQPHVERRDVLLVRRRHLGLGVGGQRSGSRVGDIRVWECRVNDRG